LLHLDFVFALSHLTLVITLDLEYLGDHSLDLFISGSLIDEHVLDAFLLRLLALVLEINGLLLRVEHLGDVEQSFEQFPLRVLRQTVKALRVQTHLNLLLQVQTRVIQLSLQCLVLSATTRGVLLHNLE
jgi:hypothetical protein